MSGYFKGGEIQHKRNPNAHRQAKKWHNVVKRTKNQEGQSLGSHPSEDLETALKALEIAEVLLEEVVDYYE